MEDELKKLEIQYKELSIVRQNTDYGASIWLNILRLRNDIKTKNEKSS